VSTPAQIGRNEWRAAVAKAQASNDELRGLLRRMMRDGGPVVQALVGQAALVLADNDRAVDRLAEIGRNSERRG